MRSAWKLLVAAAAMSCASGAGAQPWPEKPVTVVVGTPPAGAVDGYARAVGEHMTRTLGQQVIVENKPGANGNISAEQVLRARPPTATRSGSARSR